MMKLILAHCIENQMVAAKITSALKDKAIIEKVVFDYTNGMETLRKATFSSTAPVLLLISDNFLKSEKCMNDALSLVQSLGAAHRLISVTTEGIYQENGRPVILPTSFDRVSNVIQYMNHWQDRYLDLRRKKPEGDETAFNEKVRVVRTISSEIGELLRYLRSTEYYSYDQFEDSGFVVLFRVLGINVAHETTIATKASIQHTVFPSELVAVEELEPAYSGESAHYSAFGKGVSYSNNNGNNGSNGNSGKSDAHNMLDSLLSVETPLENKDLSNKVEAPAGTADKMKELASNGVVHMQESLVEKLPETPQVVDNQSPTSDFQIRAHQLINDGLDRPSSLEALIAGMRDEDTYKPKSHISEGLSRQVDAILQEEKQVSEKPNLGGFTLEQILKDEELRELVNMDAQANGETLTTETVENGIHPQAVAETKSSNGNGNGHHVHLDAEETDLVKKIAAEAEIDFQEQVRLKIEAETPTKTEKKADVIVRNLVVERHQMVAPVENFKEKTDAELRDLLIETDEDAVKSDVTRIFDEAEAPAAHFEFEENINDKLDERTAALFEQPTISRPLIPVIVSQKENNTEGVKTDADNMQQLFADSIANPNDNAARYQLAAELAQQSRLTEATEQLEILLETDRKNIEAYVLLAYLAEQQADYTLSLNSLEKVALLNPDYPGVYYKLGQLTKEHFKKQSRKALRYFQDAVAQDPSNADAQYRLAMMLIEQKGDHATAIEHLTRAVESAPQHDAAVFELAKCYVVIGDQKSAAGFYARAYELNQTFKTDAHDILFFYEEPKPEPVVVEAPAPIINDNGMTVMITGATAGIGRATAAVFAQNGYRLVLTGRRNDRLEEIKSFFEETYHNRIQILNFDVRSLDGIKAAVNALEEDFKNVDILINNAGLASGLSPIHEGDVADWEVMIDTNIKGLLYVTRAVAPSMVARRKGHIINLSSIAGKEIYPNGNVYIATKHAVDALTKAMRVDLHKYGIRVSQVAPGAVEETEFALVRFHGDAEKAKIYDEFTPLKASDVAESIYFIASRADYVNIQDIVLAGTQQAAAAFVDRSGRTDK